MVRSAIELAEVTTEDPHLGLPDPSELGSIAGDLGLYCADVAQMETPFKIELARQAEAAALDADPRIANSEGASFDTNLGRERLRQLARLRRRVSLEQLLSERRSGGARGRIDGARLLVFAGAQLLRPGKAGRHRPHRRRASRPPPGSREGGNAEGAGGLRAAHRAAR